MFKNFFCFIFFVSLCFCGCSRKKTDRTSTSNDFQNDIFEFDFLSDIYVPSLDSGEWLEDTLALLEEERVNDELESMEELEKIIKAPYENYNESENFVEIRLLDSQSRLKMLEYGSEIFVPDFLDKELVFINKSNEKVFRTFYDKNYRVIKKEFWNIKDAADFEKLITESYFYNNESLKPYKKEIVNKENIVVNQYDENGMTVYFSKKNYNALTNKYILTVESSWKYDSEKRIIFEQSTDYTKENPFVKKEIFKYHKEEEIPPDYEYYENGELKIKTEYVSKLEYKSITHFDNDNYVTAYYQDGKKIKDMYYNQDILLREKVYE